VVDADQTRPLVPVLNGYRKIITLGNLGESWYHALQIRASRSTGSLQTMAAYTLSHAEDMANYQLPEDSGNIGAEKARADTDVRHNLTAAITWELPLAGRFVGGWSISGIGTFRSNRPYTITWGDDRNGTTQNDARPDGRNTGKTEPFSNLDLAVFRRFHLVRPRSRARVEAFNVFNTTNFDEYARSCHRDAKPVSAFPKERLQLRRSALLGRNAVSVVESDQRVDHTRDEPVWHVATCLCGLHCAGTPPSRRISNSSSNPQRLPRRSPLPVTSEVFVEPGTSPCGSAGTSHCQAADGIGGTVFTPPGNAHFRHRSQFRDCHEPTWGRQKSERPRQNHEYISPEPHLTSSFEGLLARQVWAQFRRGAWHAIAQQQRRGQSGSTGSVARKIHRSQSRRIATGTIRSSRRPEGVHPEMREFWRMRSAGVDIM
jgi:hypothetical protein